MCGRIEKGMTLISLLVAVLVLLSGVLVLFRAFPVVNHLAHRSGTRIACSLVADKILTVLEDVYGNSSGPEVPVSLEGVEEEFPQYPYQAVFSEERAGLYRVELEILAKQEGRTERKYYQHVFRRR